MQDYHSSTRIYELAYHIEISFNIEQHKRPCLNHCARCLTRSFCLSVYDIINNIYIPLFLSIFSPKSGIITPTLFKENASAFSFNGVSTRVEILAPPCHLHNIPPPIEVGDIGHLVIWPEDFCPEKCGEDNR